jgi:hypothetical protein
MLECADLITHHWHSETKKFCGLIRHGLGLKIIFAQGHDFARTSPLTWTSRFKAPAELSKVSFNNSKIEWLVVP